MTTTLKEVDLAREVVEWLRGDRWEVYQEVTYRGGIADIVAVRDDHLVWIIECKTTRSCAVIEQAAAWRGLAHYRSIATPPFRETGRRVDVRQFFMLHDGIGHLVVSETTRFMGGPVRVHLEPKLDRHARGSAMRSVLREEHKTYAEAGNSRGDRYTPFQATCDQVRALLKIRPGVTMKELVGSIQHHYASTATARSSLAHWIQAGVIQGVRAEKDGRALRVYLEEGPDAR